MEKSDQEAEVFEQSRLENRETKSEISQDITTIMTEKSNKPEDHLTIN